MNVMRDLLEVQILNDAKDGDTTVLASILEGLSDKLAYASLSDVNQAKLHYYEIGVVGKDGFSTSVISLEELDVDRDFDEIIELAYKEGVLEGDDGHYVGYIEVLTYDEWVERFSDLK